MRAALFTKLNCFQTTIKKNSVMCFSKKLYFLCLGKLLSYRGIVISCLKFGAKVY